VDDPGLLREIGHFFLRDRSPKDKAGKVSSPNRRPGLFSPGRDEAATKNYLGFWLWTIAIYISAMTTKQHYFLDILGGATVMVINAALARALFEKKVKIWSSLKKSQADTI
jgi:hypothetical protein